MKTILSQDGKVALPASLRELLDLRPGDLIEIYLEGDESIILRPTNNPPNNGLVDHLLCAPKELEMPERQKDFAVAPSFDD